MPTLIACSACRAQFPAGPNYCPSCGMQLVAQALPVVKERLIPTWAVITIAIGILIIVLTLAPK